MPHRGDIRSGKKAWVDGVEVTGNVPAKSSSDLTVSGKTVTVPAGIYDSAKSVADGFRHACGYSRRDRILHPAYPSTITPKATVKRLVTLVDFRRQRDNKIYPDRIQERHADRFRADDYTVN